jgi:hypothetical protein
MVSSIDNQKETIKLISVVSIYVGWPEWLNKINIGW